MKKQLIAAAVAASMSAVAMADISITGDAKFEYDNTDTAGTTTNTTATEYHLNVAGKSGDTEVVMKFELDTDGTGSMDLEDNYIKTKVGDISVTAGNVASGTGALLGEIDEGGRERKVTLGYSMGGIDAYVGNTGGASSSSDGDLAIDRNMYAGVKFNVAGNAIELKKNSATKDSFGVKGSLSGVNYRYEASDVDGTSGGDSSYLAVDTTVGGLTVGYAVLDTDRASLLTESDSGEFAQSIAAKQSATKYYNGTATQTATGQKQFRIGTSIDGTSVTLKAGTIEKGLSATKDLDYTQIQAKRKLSSGATMIVTYNERDYYANGGSTLSSVDNLEVELNVAF
jgi:hypothetical protein